MNAITTTGAAAATVPASDLSPVLFDDFISFIDRPGRTEQTYITNLRQFAAWLSFSQIRRPIRKDILFYRQWLLSEHEAIKLQPGTAAGWAYRTDRNGQRIRLVCKPNTARQYLQAVRRFFAWTAAAGLYPNIAANIHAPKIRGDVHRKEALSPADVLRIEQSIAEGTEAARATAAASDKDTAGRIRRADEQGKRLLAMYLLAVNAGLRTIELSRANVRDLEVKAGQALLYVQGKGHAEADTALPLASEVYAALSDYLQARSDPATPGSPLFVSTGNRSGGQRLASTTISRMLKKAMQAAGYDSERITAHSLRHTAGTNMQEITGDLFVTQKYMRHSDPKTTQIYLHNDTRGAQRQAAQDLYRRYHTAQARG